MNHIGYSVKNTKQMTSRHRTALNSATSTPFVSIRNERNEEQSKAKQRQSVIVSTEYT